MDNGDTAIVKKAHILQPAIIPAPSKPQRKDEAGGQEREENVSVYLHPFTYWAGGNHRHFDAERQKVDEAAVVIALVVHSCKVVLA